MAKNLPKIKASRGYHKLASNDLAAKIKGMSFAGDPDATTPMYADTVVHPKCNDLGAAVVTHLADPTPANTTLVEGLRIQVLDMADANVGYAESIANKVARSTGDVAHGLNVLRRLAIDIAGKGGGKRTTGIVDSGEGWAHAHEDKAKKGNEGHVWNCGTTSAKDVPPEPATTKQFFSLAADYVWTFSRHNFYFAYQHGSVVPVSKKAPTLIAPNPKSGKVKKGAPVVPSSKTKHPLGDFDAGPQIVFGPWHYVYIP